MPLVQLVEREFPKFDVEGSNPSGHGPFFIKKNRCRIRIFSFKSYKKSMFFFALQIYDLHNKALLCFRYAKVIGFAAYKYKSSICFRYAKVRNPGGVPSKKICQKVR